MVKETKETNVMQEVHTCANADVSTKYLHKWLKHANKFLH